MSGYARRHAGVAIGDNALSGGDLDARVLFGRAIDRGAAGKDNAHGAGRLDLKGQ
ncbi:MAG: hypothetical protein ACE5HV_17195 [Acidobacteriota bacterium]